MRRVFVFDESKCVSCNTCTIACKDWNQVGPGPVRWRKAKTYETNSSPYFHPLAMSCNHCETPACKAACPAGAIFKRANDGVVYVDRDLCKGYKTCITACPFAEPKIADNDQEPDRYEGWQVRHPMQKCDFCMERIDEGKRPTCVDACPACALEAGDYDAMMAKHVDDKGASLLVPLNPADFPFAYVNNQTNTGPSFFVKKRRPMIFTENID